MQKAVVGGIMTGSTLPSSVDFATGFMTVVDFNKLVSESPSHVSETRSLSDPPPLTTISVTRILWDRFIAAPAVYFAACVVLTLLYTLFYGAVFLAAGLMHDFLNYVSSLQSSSLIGTLQEIWAALTRAIEAAWTTGGQTVFDFLDPYLGYFWPLYAALLILNLLDLPWRFHLGFLIPTGILLAPWRIGREYDIRLMDTSNLQFGHLKVQYGYNDQAFFVRSDTSHAAMVIDFSILRNVDFERDLEFLWRWVGKTGTPPVRIEFGDGSPPTVLHIHGAYFEHPGGRPGRERAKAFIDGLKAKLPSHAAIPPPT